MCMQIRTTGHHLEVSEAINEALNERSQKLSQHFTDIQAIDYILTVEKHGQIAEANCQYLGKAFSAKAECKDLYQSINQVHKKLENSLEKHRQKIKKASYSRDRSIIQEVETDIEDDDASMLH